MTGRRYWRSAFTVRTPEGLSRCVSVQGERTDHEIPAEPVPPSATTMYSSPGEEDGVTVFHFDVRKPGRYWFFIRAQLEGRPYPCPSVSIDGDEFKPSLLCLWSSAVPAWALVRPGQKSRWDGVTQHFDFEPGVHTLRVRQPEKGGITLLGAALSADPPSFEPK